MKLSRRYLAIPVLLGLAACGPHAAEYHRADTSSEQRKLDYDECQTQAGMAAGAVMQQGGMDTTVDTGDAPLRSLQIDAVNTCMTGKGYS